jgi:hypothetical protein
VQCYQRQVWDLCLSSFLILFCFSVNLKMSHHHCAVLNTNPNRSTAEDLGKCPLIPGEQGQWLVMGMRLVPSTPYLYLWGFIMCMEGASLSSQRQLLEALGFIVPFRFKPFRSNRVVKPVS